MWFEGTAYLCALRRRIALGARATSTHSFCKTYNVREHRCHGEAGSVDLATVEIEHQRCQRILSKFAPHNHFNFDETALFP